MENSSTRRKFIGTIAAGIFLQGCGGGSSNGSSNIGGGASSGDDSTSTPYVPVPVSVPSLLEMSKSTMYIAHRGAAALYPEETYVAYDGALQQRQVMLECDVRRLIDGGLVLMHDDTVERTTTSGGLVSGFSQAGIQELRIDANDWHGSNFGNDILVPMFAEWVSRYKMNAILVPEDKDRISMTAMLQVLAAERASKDHVLIQAFDIKPLKQAAAAGYQTCFLDLGHSDPGLLGGTGIKWAGISSDASDGELKGWIATGANILVWTVNRRWQRDAKLRFPIKGFFSDDPTYVSQNTAVSTRDRFDLQTWGGGMFGSNGDLDSMSRGKFFPGGYWGYDHLTTTYVGCLQGYLGPIKAAIETGFYALDVNVVFDVAANGDATRWASVFIGSDDQAFTDRNEGTSGHHILFRKNGAIEIYKKSVNKTAVHIASQSGSAIADREEVHYRILMSKQSVVAVRVGVAGTEQYRATAQDDSQKGAYVQLGRNGMACRFRNLIVG